MTGADSATSSSNNPNSFQLTSITPSSGQASLNWGAASGATSYKVCYGTTQALANACATFVTVTGTSTTIASLLNDTTYYFSVIAINASGVTVASVPASTTPIAAPSAPSSLVASAGLYVNQLTWNAATGSGTITYTVKRSTTTGGPYSILATGITSNAYSDITALAGTQYYYVVSATNAGGSTANSNEATATAMALVNYTWSFDQGTNASYSFDSAKIEMTRNASTQDVVRLKNFTPTDASYSSNDFSSATLSGTLWDASTQSMTLDGSGGELNGHWTPQYQSITGYWKMNGTLGASISNEDLITASIGSDLIARNVNGTGMSFVSTAQSQGVQFDGTDDSLASPVVDLFQGSDDFTVSGWINPDPTQADWASVLDWSHCGGQNFILQHYAATANTYNFAYYGTDAIFKEQQFSLTPNQWQHFAATKSGGTVKIFINGSQVSSATFGVSTITKNAARLYLGEGGTCTGRNFKGGLDEVAVWKTGLSPTEIKTIYERQSARYTGTFLSRVMNAGASTNWTALTYLPRLPYGKEMVSNQQREPYVDPTLSIASSDIIGLWYLNEASSGTAPGGKDFKDYSGQGNHGTAHGGIVYHNDRATFNGSDAYIDIPFGTTYADFTWSSWVKLKTPIVGSGIISSAPGLTATLQIGGSPNPWQYGNAWQATAAPTNIWTHLTVVQSGTSQILYVNGTQVATGTSSASFNTLNIGRRPDGVYFDGDIANVAVWKTPLNSTQVTQLYQNGPGLMLANEGLWHLNETVTGTAPGGKDFVDSSGNGHHGIINAPSGLGASGKFGAAAITSATGFISMGSASSLNVSQLGFSGWYYVNSLTGSDNILMNKENVYELRVSGGILQYALQTTSGGWYWVSTGVAIPIKKWFHVGFTFDPNATSNQVKAYLDGALVYQGVYTGTFISSSTTFQLGARESAAISGLNGYVDEVGLWSRPLTATEIQQLYQRGANRIQFQVRTCSSSTCSDDPSGLNWRGASNTASSYFSEANNTSAGSPLASAPNLTFADFGVSLTAQPYFQYRALLAADSSIAYPAFSSVSAGPAKYDGSNPVVIPIDGPQYQILQSFTVNYGAGGCSATPRFQLSRDKTNWYYYNSGWTLASASATFSEANTAPTIQSNLSTYVSSVGTGNLYVRAFLPSNTSTACEIDSINVQGGHTNPSNSSNPNSFQISSVVGQNGQALVTWNAASGATGYTVCYGTSQAAADACTLSYNAGSSTSATITSLSNGTQYFFNVIATNGSGRSPASTSGSGSPIAAPGIPSGVSASSGLYSVSLQWTSGGNSTTYTLLRGTSAGALSAFASGLTSTSFTDYTAIPGTTYYYAVRGDNAGGSSSNSSTVNATALGSFTAAPISAYNQTAQLSWTASTGATSYTVKYGTASGTYTTTLTNQTSPLTLTGLTNETTYYVLVTANNASGSANAQNELVLIPWFYPNISVNNTSLNQGGTAQFTATIDQVSLHPISFKFSTSDGSASAGTHYTARSNVTVTIPAGQTSGTFTVNTSAYTTTAGATRNFSVTMSSIQNALLSGSGVGVATLTDPSLALDFSTEILDPRVKFYRSSAGTYFDSNGVMQVSNANLILWSEDVSMSPWIIHNIDGSESGPGAASLLRYPSAGPGSMGAQTISISGSKMFRFMQDIGPLSGDYTFSLWIKDSPTCVGAYEIVITDQGTWTNPVSTATEYETRNGWKHLALTKNITSGGGRFTFDIAPGATCEITGIQLEAGTSASSYAKTTNAVGYLPRFDHDPITLEKKGLLVEGGVINQALYSAQMDQNSAWVSGTSNTSNWGLSGAVVTADQTTAPDGKMAADQISGAGSGWTSIATSRANAIASTPYTYSIYVKPGSLGYVTLANNFYNASNGSTTSYYRTFNITNCSAVNYPTGYAETQETNYHTQPLKNSWCRISITSTSPSDAAGYNGLLYLSPGAYAGNTATGADTIYAWGAQVESGLGPTSYIPSGSGVSVRQMDDVYVTDMSWYTAAGGTLVVDSISNAATSPLSRTVQLDRSSNKYVAVLAYNQTSAVQTYDGTTYRMTGTDPFTSNIVNRQATSFMNNYFTLSTNGQTVSSVVSPLPTSLTALRFATDLYHLYWFNGHFKKVQFYPSNFDNYAIQGLTTQTDRSCQTLLAAGNTTSGIYTIKPDGYNSMSAYCDMTTDGGGWTLIFNQDTATGYFTEAEALSKNAGNPSAGLYSALDQLEKFRKNGVFTMKINWPGYAKRNIWSQTTNPTVDQVVGGYSAIDIQSNSDYWGGLERNILSSTASYIDGSIGSGNWYYAIASYSVWATPGGIPASTDVAGSATSVPQTQLWVK